MEDKKSGLDLYSILVAFGCGFPIYGSLAPKWFRKELFEYIGKWIAFFVALGVAYFVWGVIRDKLRSKKKD